MPLTIRILSVVALSVICGSPQAAVLYTIGPDNPDALFPVARELTALSTSGASAPVATLPDGSVAYNGGLAFRAGSGGNPDLLYAVGNNSAFASTLYSFGTNGSGVTSVASLGFGFNGGLAYHSGNDALYAISSDPFGVSTLFSVGLSGGPPTVVSLGALGVGFMGGLTYNPDDGKLYAISYDQATGTQRLFTAITLGGVNPVVDLLFPLGDGSLSFNGGLAYDTDSDLFYSIGNDANAMSTLNSFSLLGVGVVNPVGPDFGRGFINAGLAFSSGIFVAPVSEPGIAMLSLAGLLALVLSGRRHTARRAS